MFGGSALQVGGTGGAKALGQDPCGRNSEEAPVAGAELRTEGGGEGRRGLSRSAGPCWPGRGRGGLGLLPCGTWEPPGLWAEEGRDLT